MTQKETIKQLREKVVELEKKNEEQSDAIYEMTEKFGKMLDFKDSLEKMESAHLSSIHHMETFISFYTEQLRFMRKLLVTLTVDNEKLTPENLENIDMPSYIPFEKDDYMRNSGRRNF